MTTVNILQAKSSLSRLVEAVEKGTEREIVIARNGRPAARLVALARPTTGKRIGLLEGKFKAPKDFDGDNEKIAKLFKKSR